MFSARQAALRRFWEIWRNQYITNLPPTVPDHHKGTELQIGDLVLIRDEPITQRLKWPMGRVTRLLTGKDNKVRAVELKTATSLISRPVQRLHKLEVYSEYLNLNSDINIHNNLNDIRTDPQGEVHMACHDQESIPETEDLLTGKGSGQLNKDIITKSGRHSKPPERLTYK